jgi:hypothetical protein
VPPTPPTTPLRLAQQFGNQSLDIVAVGQKMSVGAVAGEDHVARSIQRIDHADRARFLPDRGMHRPRHQPATVEVEKGLLRAPDQLHLRVESLSQEVMAHGSYEQAGRESRD